MSKTSDLIRGNVVLIVDDEELLRTFTSHVLQKSGYGAVAVSSIREAFGHLESGKIWLVIADRNLQPERDGEVFLEEVAHRYPGIKRVLMSGAVDRAEKSVGGFEVLMKPFDPTELTRLVSGLALEHATQEGPA